LGSDPAVKPLQQGLGGRGKRNILSKLTGKKGFDRKNVGKSFPQQWETKPSMVYDWGGKKKAECAQSHFAPTKSNKKGAKLRQRRFPKM